MKNKLSGATVAEILEAVKDSGREVFYFPNGGNAGDALINLGFYAAAYRARLVYREVNRDQVADLPAESIALIAGGGALVPEWDDLQKTVSKLVERNIQGIILPHSIRGVDALLLTLSENWIVFCREAVSEAYCKGLGVRANVLRDHDMAFHLNPQILMSENLPIGRMIESLFSVKNLLRYAAILSLHARAIIQKKLFAFRCDKEADLTQDLPRKKCTDLSAIARFGSARKGDSEYSGKMFLKLVNLFDEIHTDRLHVAIAASMLGKKTVIYSNSYYKVDAVYEMSIKNKFPNSRRYVC